MKRFLSVVVIISSLMLMGSPANAQKNYPVLTNAGISDAQGNLLDPNGLSEAQQVRFNITVLNLDQQQVIKAGSCEVKIALNEKLKLPEDINLKKLTHADYFAWSIVKDSKGNKCLYGKLVRDLPGNFEGVLSFELQCKGTGSSQITANLLYDVEKLNNNGLNAVGFTIIPKAGAGK